MKTDSFEKGEKFEKFVLDQIFQSSHYDLIHRTNSTSENQYRFVENSLKPDFKFRCKRNKCEFYVEAKYRSDFNPFNDKMELMRPDQWERYYDIQCSEKVPVFVVIGYHGTADYPKSLSLIPLEQLEWLDAFPSFLRKFDIPKRNIDSDNLNLLDSGTSTKNKSDYKVEKKSIKERKASKSKTFRYAVLLVLLIAFGLLGMRAYKQYNIDDSLRDKTAAYYQTIELGAVGNLDNYINPTVDKWYNKNNLTLDEIKIDTYQYLKKYPHTKTTIKWGTFEVTPLNDDYLATYQLNYQIFSKRLKNRVYHLTIKALWGENMKLKSIYEIND
jgi:hypothetical protein